MNRPNFAILLCSIATGLAFSSTVSADDSAPRCFELDTQGAPAKTAEPSSIDTTHDQTSSTDTWCYLKLNRSQQLVFNFGEGEIRTELSAIVDRAEDGSVQSITHGYLAQGKVSISKIPFSEINPFSAPLHVAEASELGREKVVAFSADHQKNTMRVVEELQSHIDANRNDEIRSFLTEGRTEVDLPAEKMPFRGIHYSYGSERMIATEFSPLQIYDQHVLARTGTNPESVEWEKKYHSLSYVSWGGHCNGWAAATALYAEPEDYLWDRHSKKVLSPFLQKGLLTSSSFCVRYAFYGKRYRRSGDDERDIDPAKFHKVLVYFIKHQQKPVLFDYFRKEWVDNNVISGYVFDIKKDANDPKKFHVTTTVKAHRYDSNPTYTLGTALRKDRTYSYTLNVDDRGRILSGEWTSSDNPDFMWVALSQRNCGRENRKVDYRVVESMLRNSPKAKEVSQDWNMLFNETLKPGNAYRIYDLKRYDLGPKIKVEIDQVDTSGRKIDIYFHGVPLTPAKHIQSEQRSFVLEHGKDLEVELEGIQAIHRFRIGVVGLNEEIDVKFRIKKVTFLGGQ